MKKKIETFGKDEESLDHILIYCLLIWDLWDALFSTLGTVGMRPFMVRDFLNTYMNFLPVRKNLRILWRVVPLSIFWAI